MSKCVRLDPSAVEALFSECATQGEVIDRLYRMVFPKWDAIVKLGGHPKVNRATWVAIAEWFFPFDRIRHPNCMWGGAWLNWGFSSSDAEHLADWQVDVTGCQITYRTEEMAHANH